MKGLSKTDKILYVCTFTTESILTYIREGKMHIELEDFTIEDARGVVLIRGNTNLPHRITQVIAPSGEDHARIGVSILSGQPLQRGQTVSGAAARRARVSHPVTVIGTEALRTFAFDIENVNEAFDKAMKKHVRTRA